MDVQVLVVLVDGVLSELYVFSDRTIAERGVSLVIGENGRDFDCSSEDGRHWVSFSSRCHVHLVNRPVRTADSL